MGYTQILTEQRDDLLLITLNRPEKLNAWTRTMNNELCDALEKANDDTSTGAIVLTGAGRGFCAGADIGESFNSRLEAEDDGSEGADDAGALAFALLMLLTEAVESRRKISDASRAVPTLL